MMRIRELAAAATIAITLNVAIARTGEAAEIRVISIPAYIYLFQKLTPAFENTTGHKLVIDFGLFSHLKGRIDAGDFDVAISTAAMTDYLAKEGKTVPSTRVEFSRIGIGVGVPAGAPKPDIGSVDAFKQTLLNAKSISIPPKESAAGGYLISLMERLGIASNIGSKLNITGGGGQTPKAVSAGEVELGITLISEFVPFRGVEIVGPLPSELQHYVVATAAVGTMAKEPNAAETLVKFLTSTPTVALFKAEGLEPVIGR